MSVVDWDSKPEPWRSLGKNWAEYCRFLAEGKPKPIKLAPLTHQPGQWELTKERKGFGERLTNRRRSIGLSQDALAEKIGVRGGTICSWEIGLKHPQQRRLLQLSRVLGVSEKWLRTGCD